MELLAKAVPVALLVFVVSSMLAVGLSLTVGQILVPLRNGRLVILALVANFVLMPLTALLIARVFRLDQPLGVALLLLGGAAGAPFLPKLAGVAKGNLAFAVGLMVLLMVLTVGYMPLVMPLLLEGVSVDPMEIARSLIVLMLLPLMIGLAVRACWARAAGRAAPVLNKISTISLAIMIVLMLVTNLRDIIDLYGTRGVLASLVFLLVGFGLGWLLGGPGRETRSVMAMGTAQRNIAAALVVGGQNFKEPRVVVMVVVVAIVGLLVLMPLGRRVARPAESGGGASRV
jgi:bile acid:Na+ symporter, BASS family